jgi:spore maturation protein CgeB
MKLVVFGLTVSSSWGNGHATLWRGLIKALAGGGHRTVFFERDVPYYAGARDCLELPNGELVLYRDWQDVAPRARTEVAEADAAIVTSYCPDGVAAGSLVCDTRLPLKVFYDLDTPVTLARLAGGESLPYLGPRGLADFDLVLSYTGGGALEALCARLGARRVVPLYGHVDPDVHCPHSLQPHYRADLSYLGTYSADRQAGLETLLIEPARRRGHGRFLIGGAQYPDDFPWAPNIYFVRHLPPAEHPAFFCSSRLTLNVTRAAMAEMGWCPSGRLFEAAACGAPVLSDVWPGLEDFFVPGREILPAAGTDDALAALDRDDAELLRIGRQARERTLDEHTSMRRAAELLAALEMAAHAPAREPMEA